jgi:hypothetical protein
MARSDRRWKLQSLGSESRHRASRSPGISVARMIISRQPTRLQAPNRCTHNSKRSAGLNAHEAVVRRSHSVLRGPRTWIMGRPNSSTTVATANTRTSPALPPPPGLGFPRSGRARPDANLARPWLGSSDPTLLAFFGAHIERRTDRREFDATVGRPTDARGRGGVTPAAQSWSLCFFDIGASA